MSAVANSRILLYFISDKFIDECTVDKFRDLVLSADWSYSYSIINSDSSNIESSDGYIEWYGPNNYTIWRAISKINRLCKKLIKDNSIIKRKITHCAICL